MLLFVTGTSFPNSVNKYPRKETGIMKVGKTFAFAQMVETLITERELSKADFQSRFDLTEDQFHRYMGNAKRYFALFHPEAEVVYAKATNLYRLRPSRKR